jgi:hypothetical protein
VAWKASAAALVCLVGVAAAGCGSSGKANPPSPEQSLRLCLRHHGYAVTPESAHVRGTAPKRFEFTSIWQLLNQNPNLRRIALTLTISKTAAGASQAAAWLRKENAKVGKGVVKAPVIQFGRYDVLWTAEPGTGDAKDIYGCVRTAQKQ